MNEHVRTHLDVVHEEYRDARGEDDDPARRDGHGGVAHGPHADAGHGVDDGHVAVEGEQDERVDGAVGGHVVQVLHHLAHGVAERPADRVVDRGRRDADGHEEQVGHRQVLEGKR